MNTSHEVIARAVPSGLGCDRRTTLAVAYRDHSKAVYGLAWRISGPTLAADVTQEVFLRFWRHPERYDPARGSLRTFLLTVTHHAAVDAIRSEGCRRTRETRAAESSDATTAPLDSGLLQKEAATRIADAINALHPLQRAAIITTFYGQCTYRETAIVLGEPEGTIKSRIRAGLQSLRISLAEPLVATEGI